MPKAVPLAQKSAKKSVHPILWQTVGFQTVKYSAYWYFVNMDNYTSFPSTFNVGISGSTVPLFNEIKTMIKYTE